MRNVLVAAIIAVGLSGCGEACYKSSPEVGYTDKIVIPYEVLDSEVIDGEVNIYSRCIVGYEEPMMIDVSSSYEECWSDYTDTQGEWNYYTIVCR